jgi:hypothetical protein
MFPAFIVGESLRNIVGVGILYLFHYESLHPTSILKKACIQRLDAGFHQNTCMGLYSPCIPSQPAR